MMAAEGREGDHPWWLWPSKGAESLGSSGHRAGQAGLETESKETAAVFSCCTGTLWTVKITLWKYGNVLFTPQCRSKALSVLLNTCAERWKLDFFFLKLQLGNETSFPVHFILRVQKHLRADVAKLLGFILNCCWYCRQYPQADRSLHRGVSHGLVRINWNG